MIPVYPNRLQWARIPGKQAVDRPWMHWWRPAGMRDGDGDVRPPAADTDTPRNGRPACLPISYEASVGSTVRPKIAVSLRTERGDHLSAAGVRDAGLQAVCAGGFTYIRRLKAFRFDCIAVHNQITMRYRQSAQALFMRLLKFGLVAVAFILASFGEASADTRTVAANKTSPIGFYYTYTHHSCHYGGKPKFKLTQAPAHGTVIAKWQASHMGGDSRNCAGKPAYGTMIIYTPKKGFRGTDSVEFDLIGSGIYPGPTYALSRSFHIDINVSAKVHSGPARPARGIGKVARSHCQRHACKKT